MAETLSGRRRFRNVHGIHVAVFCGLLISQSVRVGIIRATSRVDNLQKTNFVFSGYATKNSNCSSLLLKWNMKMMSASEYPPPTTQQKLFNNNSKYEKRCYLHWKDIGDLWNYLFHLGFTSTYHCGCVFHTNIAKTTNIIIKIDFNDEWNKVKNISCWFNLI